MRELRRELQVAGGQRLDVEQWDDGGEGQEWMLGVPATVDGSTVPEVSAHVKVRDEKINYILYFVWVGWGTE